MTWRQSRPGLRCIDMAMGGRGKAEIDRKLDELFRKFEVTLAKLEQTGDPNLAQHKQTYTYLRALEARKVLH